MTNPTPGLASETGSESPSEKPLFPRNGRKELYPGMPRYEGVAAIFDDDNGEIVVLAPSIEALRAFTARYQIADTLNPEMCTQAKLSKSP